ncbi:MAG: four helix bundle protein [Deltaproteobacteria bacterium]|nr:four helix bundle protein [Deltaproteobacteria bacterium]
MAFDALEIAIQLAAALREPLAELRRHDRDLADQARRAAGSVALNVAEAARREGRDRHHLWRVAAGSAAEVRAALALGEAWGYLGAAALAAPRALLDRELAMLWRLTHRRS